MSASPIPWKHLRNILVLFAPLWIGAVLIFGLIGASYSFLSDDVYSARLPMVVRDEAIGSVARLGRFASQAELRAAQETILEMAQNREVVTEALRKIGPPGGEVDVQWPSVTIVERTIRNSVDVLAPQGAEFGQTDVVYLEVREKDAERAIEFCHAVFDNLIEHLREIRRVRADGVIAELTHASDLARKNLDEARSTYEEMNSELVHRSEQLAEAEQRLVDAQATRSAVLSTNLVAALGLPQVSDNPVGPGAKTLTFGSMMAGLIFGLGTVFLIAPGPAQTHGRRRWTDHLEGQNRRAEDRVRLAEGLRRRSSDKERSREAGDA